MELFFKRKGVLVDGLQTMAFGRGITKYLLVSWKQTIKKKKQDILMIL